MMEYVEKRVNPRFIVTAAAYLVLPRDPLTGRRKIIRFETSNVSRSGMMIQTGHYPFKINQFYDMVLLVPMHDNVSRLYYLDAHVRWRKDGKTGFAMEKKGK